MSRSFIAHATALVLTLAVTISGCSSARSAGADDRQVEHGDRVDAALGSPMDGSSLVPEDAWAPGHDAWAGAADDASTGSCPTFTGDVQPLYQRHCATCHTTGREVHFGSSYSVAIGASSSCRTSMASCTISLGRPGGSMARRDRLGGFTTAEQATIQSWVGCGYPM